MDNERSSSRFWLVADYFRELDAAWVPTNAGYERQCLVEFDNKSWTVCLKIHVVPATHATGKRAMRLTFKASVTIWPPRLSERDERHLARIGWYAASRGALLRCGYHGKWSKSPFGKWGDFWKDLRSVAAVRREAMRLERVPVALSAINRTAGR